MNRIVVYPKDLCQFTGKSEKYARALMKKIYEHFSKSNNLPLTIFEVCDYLKVDVQQMKTWMR